MLTIPFLILTAAGLLVLVLPRLAAGLQSQDRIFSAGRVPPGRVAIVFGAGLWPDGQATPILHDRVARAVQLYKLGKIERLLLSGNGSREDHDEPGVMRQVALELGVPDSVLVLDQAGGRTYDTCYRARAIFGLNKVILVTQQYHLPRALYLCRNLGISAVGVAADLRTYRRFSMLYWNLREVAASAVAWWDVHVRHPVPLLCDPRPIFPVLDSSQSHRRI